MSLSYLRKYNEELRISITHYETTISKINIDGTITSLKEVSVNVQNDIKKVQGDVSNLKSFIDDGSS